MFPKGGNMSKLLKQAQSMKNEMDKAKKELGNLEVETKSSSGMIVVVSNGHKEIKSIKIDKSLLEEDKDFIEDAIIVAINSSNKNVDLQVEKKMSSITGGIMPGIPGF